MIATTTLDTPVGRLSIGAGSHGVRFVLWPDELRSIDPDADDLGWGKA